MRKRPIEGTTQQSQWSEKEKSLGENCSFYLTGACTPGSFAGMAV
jgi:hypothetical protein